MLKTENQAKQYLSSSDFGDATPPYRALFEKGGSLICTHTLDGTLLSINPAAASLLGYEPSELIGKSLAFAIPRSSRSLFFDYLSRIKANGADQGSLRLRTKEGGERLLLYNNVLFHPEEGGTPIVLGNALDLTALKEAEQAKMKEQFSQREQVEDVLRATRERLRTAVQNAPVILFAIDRDGVYTMAEGKALADLGEKRKLVGRSVFDVFAKYP